MRTFAPQPQATQQTMSAKSIIPGRAHFGQSREVNSIHYFQRQSGTQAERRFLHPEVESFKVDSGTASNLRFGHDFSRVAVFSGRTTLEGEEEEGPGPVSQSSDAGSPRDAGVPTPPLAPPVTPLAPLAPLVTPPSPPPRCTITTRTLVAAPDGTANTRTQVGVNEQVAMTASAPSTWTASAGTVAPTSGATVTWTAPGAGATCTVTATPARGGACSVPMTVIPPSHRSLVKKTDKAYTAGMAGSGFFADVTIMPTGVSFTRTEFREDTVNAVATGYYDTVLHWNGIAHPPTAWLRPDASNSGLVDSIGTVPPGTPGPFSAGTFLWAIPQAYRTAGTSGSGSVYSTPPQTQEMFGSSGAEGTAKEGASRGRRP
jgi:hypothetical protein